MFKHPARPASARQPIPASARREEYRLCSLPPSPQAQSGTTEDACNPSCCVAASITSTVLLCCAKTRARPLNWYFLRSLGCSPILADQALYGLPALDPGGHIDRLSGLVQRWSLPSRLVGPVIIVVLRVLGQDLP